MSSFRPTFHLMMLTFVLLLATSCYAHAGKPAGSDPEDLERWAHEACARGDMRAFYAFVERMHQTSSEPIQEPACPRHSR